MRNSKKGYITLSFVLFFCSSCQIIPERNELVSFQKNTNIILAKESSTKGQMLPITAHAIIKETIVNLEVARTSEEQSMGLMFREALPDDRGMFFPFEEPRLTRFWMNNVPVSLDMIFIKENKVLAIANSVPPCTTQPEDCPLYGPDEPIDGVLELKSGRAKSLGLAVGDLIQIEYLKASPSD